MARSDVLDPEQLDRLREKVTREIDAGNMPAAQFAFAHDGEIILAESYGDARDDTRFNIFSATKALIAGVVWQLIDEGHLSDATVVRDVLPEFGTLGTTPEWTGLVTLGDVLTHTGGFPTAPLGPPRWDTSDSRREAMAHWRCSWEPRSRFEYHPTAAHWVVAEMITAVEGRDYRDVVADRILAPLGLGEVHLGPDSAAVEVAELVATGQAPTAEEMKALFGIENFDLGEVTPEILLAFNEPSIRAVGVPGGGGTATARGMAMYYQALLHNPGGLWVGESLLDGTGHIRCTFPDPMTGVPANRTLGLVVSSDDGRSAMRGMGPTVSPAAFGHNGAGGQIVWADPETGVSFVFLTSAIERNFISEAKRTLSIASKAGLATRPTAN